MQAKSNTFLTLHHHGLTLLVHENGRRAERCNCVDQEEAVMSAGHETVSGEEHETLFASKLNCAPRGVFEAHFLQMSPMPSTG